MNGITASQILQQIREIKSVLKQSKMGGQTRYNLENQLESLQRIYDWLMADPSLRDNEDRPEDPRNIIIGYSA